jgi:hypothetical protein
MYGLFNRRLGQSVFLHTDIVALDGIQRPLSIMSTRRTD